MVVWSQRRWIFPDCGFLGMMYYFIPKQAERPVYSYKLSIIHFWALIFIYIWAGPTTCITRLCLIGPRHWVWCFQSSFGCRHGVV